MALDALGHLRVSTLTLLPMSAPTLLLSVVSVDRRKAGPDIDAGSIAVASSRLRPISAATPIDVRSLLEGSEFRGRCHVDASYRPGPATVAEKAQLLRSLSVYDK